MDRLRGPLGVAVALVVVLAVGVGIGALLFADDDRSSSVAGSTTSTSAADGSSTSSSTSSTTPVSPPQSRPVGTVPVEGLAGDALDFAVALNAARDLDYHARYEGERTEAGGTATSVVVEVWRRNPLARRDFTVVGGSQQVASREYTTETGVVGCLDASNDGVENFSCTDATASGSDPAAPAFGAVDPHGGPVTAIDDSVDGVSVRCFQVAPTDGNPQEVCFDSGGIPVVVDDGDYRLVRTLIDDQMVAEDFTPPEG